MQVSPVDLCVDSIGWDVASTNWQEAFVSRAVGQNGRPADAPIDGPDVAPAAPLEKDSNTRLRQAYLAHLVLHLSQVGGNQAKVTDKSMVSWPVEAERVGRSLRGVACRVPLDA